MTTEGAAPAGAIEGFDTTADDADDGRLFCYRHPDRVTYVRCGRCDRPICPRCAMQGPVGFRCRDCGKPVNDPMTSFSTRQLVLGGLVSLVAGTIAGVVASRIGFFSIFVSFFAGGLIADAVMRVTGYKRGPVMVGILVGGIVLGTLVAFGIDYGLFLADMQSMLDAARAAGEDPAAYGLDIGFTSYLLDAGVWALISAGAAIAGAWGRLRF